VSHSSAASNYTRSEPKLLRRIGKQNNKAIRHPQWGHQSKGMLFGNFETNRPFLDAAVC
jgi:hypothetical protein